MKKLRSSFTGLVFMLILCISSINLVGCNNISKNLIETETIDVEMSQGEPIDLTIVDSRPYISDRTFVYTSRKVSPESLFYEVQDIPEDVDLEDLYWDSSMYYNTFYMNSCTPEIAKKWDMIINLHPKYKPIYENKDGNIYFLNESGVPFKNIGILSYTNVNSEDNLITTAQGIKLLSPYGEELPVIESPSPILDNCFPIFYSVKNGLVIMKKMDAVVPDQSYLILLALESQKVFPLQSLEGNIKAVYPTSSGYVINTTLNSSLMQTMYQSFYGFQKNTGLPSGKQNFYYLDIATGELTLLSAPSKTSACYTSSLNQIIFWYDALETTLYEQNIETDKKAIMLSDQISAYSILPISSGAWVIPEQDPVEPLNLLYYIKSNEKPTRILKCKIPMSLYQNKGLYLDAEGNINHLLKDKITDASLYVISPSSINILHKFPIYSKDPIADIDVYQYVNSVEEYQRVEVYLRYSTTEEDYLENRRKIHPMNLYQYKLPDLKKQVSKE